MRWTTKISVETSELVVEATLEASGRGYVVTRLNAGASTPFDVLEGAMLAGSPVEPWLEMPRALDATGKQRTDLFGFCLKSRDDLAFSK